METKEQINQLLLSIKKTIKTVVNRGQNFDKSIEEYSKLQHDYNQIINDIDLYKVNGFVKGIFYHHNVENYAKITMIYEINKDEFLYLEHYGDDKLLSLPIEILNNNKNNLILNIVKKFFIVEKDGLQYNLYAYNLDNKFLIAAVVSSYYFKISKFQFFCDFFKSMENKNAVSRLPVLIDNFKYIKNELQEIMSDNKQNKIVYHAEFFCFDSIKKIFEKTTLATFLNIVHCILDSIIKSYTNNTKIYILSLTHFLVISHEIDNKSCKISNIIVDYNGIPIPFKAEKVNIDTSESIYNMFDQIQNIIDGQ